MRLSEALILRSDLHQRIQQIRERLVRSSRVQEDEQAPENPQELLQELERLISNFSQIAASINRTNQSTIYENKRTLTDALAERDAIILHRRILSDLVAAATGEHSGHRYRYVQGIKFFSTVSISEIQQQIDSLARRYREIDTRIQEKNWTTELLE
jgi:hypothetical protein